MRRVLASLLLLCAPALAQEPPRAPRETDAYTFWGGYMWRQTMAQGVPNGTGGYTMQRGDFWGGRLIGGLGLGRVGFAMRLDASGLKDQFDVNDPATFKTLEAYGAGYFVLAAARGIQVGPIAVVGSTMNLDEQTIAKTNEWPGVGVNIYGAGLRVAGMGSELEVLAVRTERYLRQDPRVRLAVVAHVRLTDRLYGVGDVVSGQDGFIRVGVAVRAF